MSIGFILFLYNLFLCDIDSIYTMFFLILLVILYGPRVCNKRLNMTYLEHTSFDKQKKSPKNTLLSKIKVAILKKW